MITSYLLGNSTEEIIKEQTISEGLLAYFFLMSYFITLPRLQLSLLFL